MLDTSGKNTDRQTLLVFNTYFSWQHYEVVDSSTRVKVNPLLHFHWKIEHFYIVDSSTYDNNKKGTIVAFR
jgi:hypothetical protein